MRLLILFITLFDFAYAKVEEKKCHNQPNKEWCITYKSNFDGDTISFNIDGVNEIIGKNFVLRLKSHVAPELNSTSPCEHDRAIAAKKQVRDWLTTASRIYLKNIEQKKHLNFYGDIEFNGKSLGEELRKLGLAYRYRLGKKPLKNWCDYRGHY